VVIISPGIFGGDIQFYNKFKQKGRTNAVIYAETECMIYECRKDSLTKIWIKSGRSTIISIRRNPQIGHLYIAGILTNLCIGERHRMDTGALLHP